MRKRTIKREDSGRLKMAIAVGFKVLKILCVKEAKNREEAPQVRSERKQIIKIELAVACFDAKNDEN